MDSYASGPTAAPVPRGIRRFVLPHTLVDTNASQLTWQRSSFLNSGQLAWGIVKSGNWRHSLLTPMAFHQNSIFIRCGLSITKSRLVCASNLQIRQPTNWYALATGNSVILDSYGLLPATIPIQTQQLTDTSIRWMALTVPCWWWMSSRVMHGCSYVCLRSHPSRRCPLSYGCLALQNVGSYDVTKTGNLPKAPSGALTC